ncbi:MAG: RNA-binding transcriptional accessory protein, partial [Pirellulales bacterium]|nr:RNA-binding transcriptional accessory protein [Pirellulales bacterium]
MASETTIDVEQIAGSLQLAPKQVARTAELLDAGNTVPFITRYRKDHTGGLDEVQIRAVQEEFARLRQLADRKHAILKSIETQGKLTPELSAAIERARSTKVLEDLYLPFKPKKQTLATQARERGLGEFAEAVLGGSEAIELETRAQQLVDPEKQLTSAEDVLAGVGHIIAETYSERADLRQALRKIFRNTAQLVSTGAPAAKEPTDSPESVKPEPSATADAANSKDSEQAKTEPAETPKKSPSSKKADKRRAQEEKLRHAFRDYFDFRQKAAQVPPHRVLAINRGERKKMLRVKVDVDLDKLSAEAERIALTDAHPQRDFLKQCVADALARLILPGLER